MRAEGPERKAVVCRLRSWKACEQLTREHGEIGLNHVPMPELMLSCRSPRPPPQTQVEGGHHPLHRPSSSYLMPEGWTSSAERLSSSKPSARVEHVRVQTALCLFAGRLNGANQATTL